MEIFVMPILVGLVTAFIIWGLKHACRFFLEWLNRMIENRNPVKYIVYTIWFISILVLIGLMYFQRQIFFDLYSLFFYFIIIVVNVCFFTFVYLYNPPIIGPGFIKKGKQYVQDTDLLMTLYYLLKTIDKIEKIFENRYARGFYRNKKDVKTIQIPQKLAPSIELALEIEKLIIDDIDQMKVERFRYCNIQSDESHNINRDGTRYTFVIDPIDGSRQFKRNLPLFTTSIALLEGKETLLSIVYAPVTRELFFAIRGCGAYCNSWDNQLRVTKNSIHESLNHVEFPNKDIPKKDFKSGYVSLENIFAQSQRIRGLGVGSLGLAYVAKGAFDAYVTLPGTTLDIDVIAGMHLVKEAGGEIYSIDTPEITSDGIRVIASNRVIFKELSNYTSKIIPQEETEQSSTNSE